MLCFMSLIDNEDDRAKFERLYHTYKQKLYYVAFYILKDEQEAENMVHDTFIAIIDILNRIDEEESHKTWNYIVTILKNKCFNFLKANKRISYMEEMPENSSQFDTEREVIRKETSFLLAEELMKLEYPDKEILYLTYYNGLRSKEIGEILGLSSDNVRQRIKRSKTRLKKMLMERGVSV
ncbi:MAG: sigma-70 family RNA polymerase sigma factor [Lachnospiraceae bacterium]|nr:sigma-70 family RNA polymerase sigma factor [Lachnospiraceae bacterium]